MSLYAEAREIFSTCCHNVRIQEGNEIDLRQNRINGSNSNVNSNVNGNPGSNPGSNPGDNSDNESSYGVNEFDKIYNGVATKSPKNSHVSFPEKISNNLHILKTQKNTDYYKFLNIKESSISDTLKNSSQFQNPANFLNLVQWESSLKSLQSSQSAQPVDSAKFDTQIDVLTPIFERSINSLLTLVESPQMTVEQRNQIFDNVSNDINMISDISVANHFSELSDISQLVKSMLTHSLHTTRRSYISDVNTYYRDKHLSPLFEERTLIDNKVSQLYSDSLCVVSLIKSDKISKSLEKFNKMNKTVESVNSNKKINIAGNFIKIEGKIFPFDWLYEELKHEELKHEELKHEKLKHEELQKKNKHDKRAKLQNLEWTNKKQSKNYFNKKIKN